MLDIRYVKDKEILKCKSEIQSPSTWQLKHDARCCRLDILGAVDRGLFLPGGQSLWGLDCRRVNGVLARGVGGLHSEVLSPMEGGNFHKE
jgi:hypothetical protein